MAEVVCKHCGKSFDMPSWAIRLGRGKYCSHECASEARQGANPKVIYVKTCEYCSVEFVANKREQKYCSRECVNQSLRGSRSDKANAVREIEIVDPWASGAIGPVCYDSDYYYTPDAMHGF